MNVKSPRASPRGARAAPAAVAVPAEPPRRLIARLRAAPRADQPDRKLNILVAAEKLFAQHGFHGVSIRDIAQAAGVPLALVGYHYGAKQQLYEAIFESWRPMIEVRWHRLDEALASGPAAQRLTRILEAFVIPVLELHRHEEGRHYAQMAARDLAAPGAEAEAIHNRYFDPLAHRFIDALCGVFPKSTRGEVAWCYQFMLGALLHYMNDCRVERLSKGENKAADPAAQAHLLRFIEAGCRAVLEAPHK